MEGSDSFDVNILWYFSLFEPWTTVTRFIIAVSWDHTLSSLRCREYHDMIYITSSPIRRVHMIDSVSSGKTASLTWSGGLPKCISVLSRVLTKKTGKFWNWNLNGN